MARFKKRTLALVNPNVVGLNEILRQFGMIEQHLLVKITNIRSTLNEKIDALFG